MKLKSIALIAIVLLSFSFKNAKPEELPKLKTVYEDFYEVGDRIIAPEILFGFDSNRILLELGHDSILHLAQFFEKHQEFAYEIGFHTDTRGNAEYNLRLSEGRAKSVRHYMEAEYHLMNYDITWKGYGESEPIISNENICCKEDKEKLESQHARNRRIELRILGMSGR